ncbi:hypothetical protein ROZALSC1DRAFT_26793 [Rozella allomycis CSF55]|uniref:Uncharacterized protein n=1 Tax=Rozella allomycis (strain CSF55) TaxID=988480 RepID=A0A4P9YPV4_ROZAC|nr:hypothetical protein ROZALSC1DRAFT_26793 [Rozella allomycis CSF55]
MLSAEPKLELPSEIENDGNVQNDQNYSYANPYYVEPNIQHEHNTIYSPTIQNENDIQYQTYSDYYSQQQMYPYANLNIQPSIHNNPLHTVPPQATPEVQINMQPQQANNNTGKDAQKTIWNWAVDASKSLLGGIDFIGEKVANAIGITSSKYQTYIDYAERMKELDLEEQRLELKKENSRYLQLESQVSNRK